MCGATWNWGSYQEDTRRILQRRLQEQVRVLDVAMGGRSLCQGQAHGALCLGTGVTLTHMVSCLSAPAGIKCEPSKICPG